MVDERELTTSLARFFPGHRDLVVPIGDDAAVARQRHRQVALCCDPVIGGVHFDEHAPWRKVGRKAVNRNVSDLAAMGALPDWLLVSVIAPRGTDAKRFRQLLRGVRDAAEAASAVVVGGDVATSSGPLVVTVSAYGHVADRALTRSGAQAGDTLHCSGPVGGSLAGHHLTFRPHLAEGCWLARQRAVHAAIDISDGLLLDLATMLAASGGLGAELDASAIPVRAAARRLAGGDRERALRRALGDGEDHVLLWAQAPGPLAGGGPLTARARRPIGRVTAEPGLWLVQHGRRRALRPVGFQHEL